MTEEALSIGLGISWRNIAIAQVTGSGVPFWDSLRYGLFSPAICGQPAAGLLMIREQSR
jgi:hypothetical protein